MFSKLVQRFHWQVKKAQKWLKGKWAKAKKLHCHFLALRICSWRRMKKSLSRSRLSNNLATGALSCARSCSAPSPPPTLKSWATSSPTPAAAF
jgi:hypothetical protein